MVVVLKFGGSSLVPHGFNVIYDQLKTIKEETIVVVSAIGNTTDVLYKIANLDNPWTHLEELEDYHVELCGELGLEKIKISEHFRTLENIIKEYISNPSIDIIQTKISIISYGEILSSFILNAYLVNRGILSDLLNARHFMMNTDDHHKIDSHSLHIGGKFYVNVDKLEEMMLSPVTVTQGFIASTQNYKFCIMTRSGSDTSASLIASAIKAKRLEIWTDVDGMYTGDPRAISDAKIIRTISYDLCQELSTMGSHVIHPLAIFPCKEAKVPIHIRNTFNSSDSGTVIMDGDHDDPDAICILKNITLIKVCSMNMWQQYGFAERIFNVFAVNKIDIDIISSSSVSISVTTSETNMKKLEDAKVKLAKHYKTDMYTDCQCISLVSKNIYERKISELQYELKDDSLLIHPSTNGKSVSFVIEKSKCNSTIDKINKIIN